MREACLRYLETGESPAGKPGWLLPATDLVKNKNRHSGKLPFTDCLVDSAIHEKRIDDVVRWHKVEKKSKTGFGRQRDREVAEAVFHKYPDRAVASWKDIAERLIAQTNVKIYGEAVSYLKKVQRALEEIKKTSEWESYFNLLVEKHRRKTRLLQMLNLLRRKKLLFSAPLDG